MNTLFYKASFKQIQGGRSVNLSAKFKRVLGFEKRKVFNVDLIYQSRDGNLTKLDLKGLEQMVEVMMFKRNEMVIKLFSQ